MCQDTESYHEAEHEVTEGTCNQQLPTPHGSTVNTAGRIKSRMVRIDKAPRCWRPCPNERADTAVLAYDSLRIGPT
eukprot:165569-Amphidinium_carterae.1